MRRAGALLFAWLAGCAALPPETPSDAAISTMVKAALAAQSTIYPPNVDVRTDNGIVQLTGYVYSRFDERRAIEAARRIEGVRDVRSALIAPSESGSRRR